MQFLKISSENIFEVKCVVLIFIWLVKNDYFMYFYLRGNKMDLLWELKFLGNPFIADMFKNYL